MTFINKLKNFAKNNWSFGTLILVPVLRFVWRTLIAPPKSSSSSSSTSSISGDTYKKGDVIDVQVKK